MNSNIVETINKLNNDYNALIDIVKQDVKLSRSNPELLDVYNKLFETHRNDINKLIRHLKKKQEYRRNHEARKHRYYTPVPKNEEDKPNNDNNETELPDNQDNA